MEQINLKYNELLDHTKPKYGATHGLQILHQGNKVNDNSILVVGRENRGHGHILNDLTTPINCFTLNGFDWLKKDYKFTKSPFLRVIGKTLHNLTGEDYGSEIFEKIYWTNLFKVSPKLKKANTHKMRMFQVEICQELLREEINFIKPTAIVFLTDNWVDPFLSSWEENQFITTPQNEESLGFYNRTFNFKTDNKIIPAIVLPHPQYKKSGASEADLINYLTSNIQPLLN